MKATLSSPFPATTAPSSTLPGRLHDLRIHMVGIGGSGMSGLARLLAAKGAQVSGTDQRPSELLGRLGACGVRVSVRQEAASVPCDVELIVASAAIAGDHPEIAEARRRGIPVIKYSQMLGCVMAGMDGIAVAGTHGKSTTTSWLAYTLRAAGRDPSFVVGAEVEQLGGGSGVGGGAQFVVEACEYDRSFLNLPPRRAVILNIEADHLDCYADLDDIAAAFSEFARRLPPDGLLVLNGEDARCRRVAGEVSCRVASIALRGGADWTVRGLRTENGCPRFEVMHDGAAVGEVGIALAGKHNVFNALAVAALAHDVGLPWADIRAGLEGFRGARRRMELRGELRGIRVVDDYGHHPTEVRATLAAARERFAPRRLWCVFQPHQYSRTRALLAEFAQAFGDADVVLVPDVYEARDSHRAQPISSAELVKQIRGSGGQAEHMRGFDAIVERLVREACADDLVLTMGAGDVWKVADELVRQLSTHMPA